MPCRDGGPIYPDDMLRTQADRNARVACEALAQLEASGVPYTLSAEARVWWDAHKAADARRLLAEKQAAEREALRQTALTKLTAAEAKALGL